MASLHAAHYPIIQPIYSIQPQVLVINRAKAIKNDIEGKTQENIGNITGNQKDKMVGKAKQAESMIRNAVEDTKGKIQLKERAKAATKDIEGKIQETTGKITGNRKDQIIGRTKQAESQVINTIEDMKDTANNILK